MRKSIFRFIFIFLVSNYSWGQNKRFVYQYKSVPDSTQKENIVEKIYFLDVYKGYSIFYDADKAREDSLLAMSNDGGSVEYGDKVIKKYPTYDLSLITKVYDNVYSVNDNREFDWKLLDNQNSIMNLKAQDAKIFFAGREWTAWFTPEIPIQDGPYKFKGLPGLIVNIYDNKNHHIFELIEIMRLTTSEEFTDKNLVKISYNKFRELYREYRENPIKSWIQKEVRVTEDGLKSPEDVMFLKNMENYFKKRIEKDNNIIEIDLLQK